MNWERAKEIGTHGGCGWLALAILRRRGGVPLLRYDSDGRAVHAGVLLDGQIIHLGDCDARFVPVDMDEMRRACREDFMPSRVNLVAGEIRRVVELMGLWLEGEER